MEYNADMLGWTAAAVHALESTHTEHREPNTCFNHGHHDTDRGWGLPCGNSHHRVAFLLPNRHTMWRFCSQRIASSLDSSGFVGWHRKCIGIIRTQTRSKQND